MSVSADMIQSSLDQALDRYGVPGAALGLLVKGERFIAASGLADVETGRTVNAETIFRLGSLTKVLTAVLAMRFVQKDLLSLDEPLALRWRDFQLADDAATKEMTLRHLLSHTSGLFGDYLQTFGDDEASIARYADAAINIEQAARPGAAFSYCNAAFVLAARACEVAANARWDALMRAYVIEGMDMVRTGTRRQDLPDDNVAVSHVPGADGKPAPVRNEEFSQSLAPAGATAWTSANGVLNFANYLLSEQSLLARMTPLQVKSPAPSFACGWGLGFARYDDAGDCVGHDGAVKGQQSFFRFRPADGAAIVLLTNGGDGRAMFAELTARIGKALSVSFQDSQPRWPAKPDAGNVDELLGRYAVRDYAVDVALSDAELTATLSPLGHAWDFDRPVTAPLRRDPDDVSGDRFLTLFPGASLPTHQRFHRNEKGAVEALTFRGRRFPRDAQGS